MKLLDMETFSYSNGKMSNNSNNSRSSSNITSHKDDDEDGDGDGDGDGTMANVTPCNGEEILIDERLISGNRVNGREWRSWMLTSRFRRSIGFCLYSFNVNGDDGPLHHISNYSHNNGMISPCLDEMNTMKKTKAKTKTKHKNPQFSKQISDISLSASCHKMNNPTASIEGQAKDQEKIRNDYRRAMSLPPIRLSQAEDLAKCEKGRYCECSCEGSLTHQDDEDCHGGKSTKGTCPNDDVLLKGTKCSNTTMVTSSWSEFITSHGIHDNDGDGHDDELLDCVYDRDASGFDWAVDLSELFLGHKFASGTHSRLYLGQYKGLDVAVKLLCKPHDNEQIAIRLEQQFRCEINVLSQVEHPNIVKFVGACKKPPVCCIITEYLAVGSLRSYLQNQQPCMLALSVVVAMALDVALGMEYLHSKGVIHRDLKSENLVISNSLCVKITDFGVACLVDPKSLFSYGVATEDVGTYRWMAPEMIRRRQFSKKADVYSFGIVLWELVTGHVPFRELTPVQAAFAVVHKDAMPPIPSSCPEVLTHLMLQCWCRNPNKRPDFSEIVNVLKTINVSICST